jgi:tRNA threonylcarbamoyladenosine biosynthesis protein TsaE
MTDTLPAETTSPMDTLEVGRRLADRLKPGQVVALYGDLGSGKTHLAKGICAGLGLDPEHVTSPTFALINEYVGKKWTVYHFDTYRLKSLDEFLALGYEEYFEGDGVCLIEWPEVVESVLPDDVIRIRLSHRNGDRRYIEFTSPGVHG